ncbi:MAG: 50S ribosomal protein L21 [Patescibacteria group bacterium]
MFAIVSYKGNQYKLTPGRECEIDLVAPADRSGNQIIFDNVLLIADEKNVNIGQPSLGQAKVAAEVLGDFHGKKLRVFKFHAKKRYKRTLGQREDLTRIKVLEIRKDEK